MKSIKILCLLSSLSVCIGTLLAQPAKIVIDVQGESKPWTHLDVNNGEDQFQFAIVTDRTGGHRPGVFMDGVNKLNLLQPEFVMSVGDLIEGYTEDVAEIDRQWDEFDGFVDQVVHALFLCSRKPRLYQSGHGQKMGRKARCFLLPLCV